MRRECTQHVNVFALHCPPIFVLTPCLCHTTQHQNQHQHHMRTALFFYRIPIFGPTFLFTAYSPNLDSISNSPPPPPHLPAFQCGTAGAATARCGTVCRYDDYQMNITRCAWVLLIYYQFIQSVKIKLRMYHVIEGGGWQRWAWNAVCV